MSKTGTDDVRKTENDRRHIAHRNVGGNERLARKLGAAVVRNRHKSARGFTQKNIRHFAVNRRGRSKKHLFNVCLSHAFKQCTSGKKRIVKVNSRLLAALLYIRIRGEVENGVYFVFSEYPVRVLRDRQIGFVKPENGI